jgi:hypothetical protein
MTLTGTPKVIREFFESHCRPKSEVYEDETSDKHKCTWDFNTLIPMPKALDVASQHPETPEMKANQKKYGYASWYEWRIDNWGTKWNAYDCKVDLYSGLPALGGEGKNLVLPLKHTLQINFDTAWSLPEHILNEVLDLYPELELYLECVEEGGFFAGYIHHIPGQEPMVNLSESLWKEYARKFYGDDYFDDYEEEELDVNFNEDGSIEGECSEVEPKKELPSSLLDV